MFRLAPPQSRGWKIYADFLLARGFRQVIEIIREDLYWTSGSEVIRRRVEPAGVRDGQLGRFGIDDQRPDRRCRRR
jgi:hypothetical protein